MDGRLLANRMRYGLIAVLLLAAVMCVWAAVLGVGVAVDSSAAGGIAVVVASALMLTGIGWRLRFQWERIHRSGP